MRAVTGSVLCQSDNQPLVFGVKWASIEALRMPFAIVRGVSLRRKPRRRNRRDGADQRNKGDSGW
jgi:hypothetical protein